MNKKQKKAVAATGLIIIAAFVTWAFFGFEIFTKYSVLVETQTDLESELGISRKEWRDQFIWGLDYTLVVTAVAVIAGSLAVYFLRTKKKGG